VIPIVAGFQGVSPEREITTLGRGGSDVTAVAIAAAALITDARNEGKLAAHVGIFAATALIQTALTLAMATIF